MAQLISAADLENLESVADLCDWVSLLDAAWEAVNTMLGTAPHIRVLAFMPSAAIREAVAAARVPVPAAGVAGEPGYVAATTRPLTAVECTQVGLMFQLAQLKLGRPASDPLTPPPPPAGGGAPPNLPGVPPQTTGGRGRQEG
jgi:hypothetical protein